MSEHEEPDVVEETTPAVVPFGILEAPATPAAIAAEPSVTSVTVTVTEEIAMSADAVLDEVVEVIEVTESDGTTERIEIIDTTIVVDTGEGVGVVETIEVRESVAIPLPGPAPTPARLGRPRPSSTPASAPPMRRTDPSRFGRIDDDGTAWLRTPQGEVVVGNWAAGTREEGLAFFGRKYDDILVEVDLAAHRLREGRGADAARTAVEHGRAALAAPAFIGDVEQLAAACDEIEALLTAQKAQREAARQRQREEALAAREALVVEAESLAESRQWKATGDRFTALLEAWKTAPRIDRGREQAMWKRFSAARGTFDRARRQHFAGLEGQRKEAISAKQRLIAEAQALSTSTAWGETSRAYRDLMARWKASGNAGRQDEDRLWSAFRAAQESFFTARDAANAERDASLQDNLAKKLALASEAEALLPVTDIAAAKRSLRAIQERWEGIGHVPRADRDRVEGRLRSVEEAIRSADQKRWSTTNPEVRARAEDTATKFRAALDRAEAALAEARARGDQRAIDDAERSVESTRALLVAVEGTVSEFS